MDHSSSISSFSDIYVDDPLTPSSTTSWASIIEEDLQKSSEFQEINLTTQTKINLPKKIQLNEIINIDLIKLNDFEIIYYQSQLLAHLRSTFEISELYLIELKKYLEWIKLSSLFLSNKLKLQVNKNEKKISLEENIPRSSYKFCRFKHECDFNYDHQNYIGCLAQHYVHNLIYSDVNILLTYLNLTDDYTKYNQTEIKKTIETLDFVVNHMVEELSEIIKIYSQNFEKYHMERSPPCSNKKKNKKRKKFMNNKV